MQTAAPTKHHVRGAPTLKVVVPNTYRGFIQQSVESYKGRMTEYVWVNPIESQMTDVSMLGSDLCLTSLDLNPPSPRK